MLQLQGASGLTTATLGDSSHVRLGDKVVAIGNALGKNGTPSVAPGRVTGLGQAITASDEGSGTSEQLSGLIRTNAAIQAGDSGGPLTNASGQVIGIDTAGSSGSVQLNSSTATQAFTIPINNALTIAHQIEVSASSAAVRIGSTAFLGIEVASRSQTPGTPASSRAQDQPASPRARRRRRRGLGAGDTITSLAGHSITSPTQIRSVLNGYHPGQRVSISWTDQSGASHTGTVNLAVGPAA